MVTWSRRQILRGSVAASAAMALRTYASGILSSSGSEISQDGALRQDLNGSAWTMHEEDAVERIPAVVPGCTFIDLMRGGKIPDPYFRENEGVVSWVAERNWVYERTFTVSDLLRSAPYVELVCEGLDTIAHVWLNDEKLGSPDNMFRTWRFDVKSLLKPGQNTLRVRIDALTPYVTQRAWAAGKQWYGLFHSWPEPAYVRKAAYMWGWDFACKLPTQGIWKNIFLQGFSARITDLHVLQTHLPDGRVQLEIRAEAAGDLAGYAMRTQVSLGDTVISRSSGSVADKQMSTQAMIADPQLWWPNGLGEHPLYTVEAKLCDPAGQIQETVSRRIGLRTIEVSAAVEGSSKHVRINGVPVFLKGADWAPLDNLPTQVTTDIVRWYVAKAAECNFNFFRLWGGAYYEEESFFSLCDESGIMVQFEFKFANSVYPVKDDQWMDNVRKEIEEQTRRCRNHACIVIWSGNNEVGKFDGYDQLFADLIGGTVHQLAPGAYYEVGSGGGAGVKLEEVRNGSQISMRMSGTGDIHACRVWHLQAPLETYHDLQGFFAEVGIQSFPVPRSVETYTDLADRKSINTPSMIDHERDGSGDGYGIINYYDALYFGKAADSFEAVLWLSQITQAWGLRYGIEYWRRSRPQSMATVIWQYNDCWPGVTWSLIDYYRRCKAAQYQAKHFFAPILVSGTPDPQSGQVELHVTNDQRGALAGELRWLVTDLAGENLEQGSIPIAIAGSSTQMTHILDLLSHIKSRGAHQLLIWVEVVNEKQALARNTLFFGRPLDMKLSQPHVSVQISGEGKDYQVEIGTDIPALWVWADLEALDAEYSDNFVHLRPDRTETLRVTLDKPISREEFRNKLKIRSIYDVAPDMRRDGGA
jgi:beta-mannosidase